jgi:hypothetical protein
MARVTPFAAGGLFFNEWYWEPIFRALYALPVLVIVAFVTDFAVRRWARRLAWPLRGGLAAGIVFGGTALILVGGLVIESGRYARESRAIARTIQFTTYEPRSLPPRFVLESSAAGAGRDSPAIYAFYLMTGNGFASGHASVIQERPPGESNRYSGRCLLEGASGTCREVRSPKGIRVMLATDVARSLEGSALLGGTLVSVSGSEITEDELLAYFDALRPVAPDEIEFKRG